MYKSSALKCEKCPHFVNGKCLVSKEKKNSKDLCNIVGKPLLNNSDA